MKANSLKLFGLILLLTGGATEAQEKKNVINDSNTALHLLQPEYKIPYRVLSVDDVKKDMDRILHYLRNNTPTRVVDKNTGKVITDYNKITKDSQLERGDFKIASYEWGVTYSGMLSAAEATGDESYFKYVKDRFNFISEIAQYIKKIYQKCY